MTLTSRVFRRGLARSIHIYVFSLPVSSVSRPPFQPPEDPAQPWRRAGVRRGHRRVPAGTARPQSSQEGARPRVRGGAAVTAQECWGTGGHPGFRPRALQSPPPPPGLNSRLDPTFLWVPATDVEVAPPLRPRAGAASGLEGHPASPSSPPRTFRRRRAGRG